MKSFACVFLSLASIANADTLNLATPNTVTLKPTVSIFGCYAAQGTTSPYKTTVTGFSADGNYVLGQVTSHYTCGRSGRGGTVHTVYLCTYLTWDLSGNLVSVNTPSSLKNMYCSGVSLVYPPATPPAQTVVGNEFTNSGGYMAETVLAEACGSVACYATYFYPTFVTP